MCVYTHKKVKVGGGAQGGGQGRDEGQYKKIPPSLPSPSHLINNFPSPSLPSCPFPSTHPKLAYFSCPPPPSPSHPLQ